MPENSHDQGPRRGQERYVASAEVVSVGTVDAISADEAPSSMWQDAWREMRRRPMFWAALTIIVVAIVVALLPGIFVNQGPRDCDLSESLLPPSGEHFFGTTKDGCDIYSRVIHGAQPSVTVGVLATLFAVVIGATVGAIAGYFGGWLDSLLSRITDIFFALPFFLAALVILSLLPERDAFAVAVVLASFGWTSIARITRGSVLSVKNNEFVTAAKALGMSRMGILVKHALPNAAAPIIVYGTVALGTFVVAEATLTFLGIGLPGSTISWGGDLSLGRTIIREAPEVMAPPAIALGTTVLGFIMMGDVVRDALDPKARKR